ncbi:hypothetical protein [Pyrolobus fumarii]|nr:hypothetical protein [Pyrolobus fumarii]
MIVTVGGFSPSDSGKTRLTARLIHALHEIGLEPTVVKPIGSHNMWQQHFSLHYSLEHRILVGGDAIRLAKAAGAKPEDIQPVDLLLAPPDITRYLTRIRDYLATLESLLSQVVVLRVSRCEGNGVEHLHAVVPEHIEALPPTLRTIIDELAERLDPPPITLPSSRLYELMNSGDLLIAADLCTAKLVSGSRLALIESFNDVLIPTPTSTKSRLFIVVGPGRAIVYRGDDVVKAASIVSGLKPGSLRASEVLHLVKPLQVLDVEFAYADDQVGNDVRRLTELLVKMLESDDLYKG